MSLNKSLELISLSFDENDCEIVKKKEETRNTELFDCVILGKNPEELFDKFIESYQNDGGDKYNRILTNNDIKIKAVEIMKNNFTQNDIIYMIDEPIFIQALFENIEMKLKKS
jgi:hypothetical protein